MGNCAMNEPKGPQIESPAQMAGLFLTNVLDRTAAWQTRLQQSPDELETIEREVQTQFMAGAGMLVSGLLAVVLASPQLAAVSEQTRQEFKQPLSPGRNRTVKVQKGPVGGEIGSGGGVGNNNSSSRINERRESAAPLLFGAVLKS